MNITNLEIHLVHACNLDCEGCSHYSNQGHKGIVSLDDAGRWMAAWSGRISPKMFSLLGGEPTLHPQLTSFFALARQHWPHAHLRLLTNGFFLHRHAELPAFLQRDNNVSIELSIHYDSPEYREKLQPVHELLKRWARDYGIRAGYYQSFSNWTRRYHGSGSAMEPFNDGQPRQSWENCLAKRNCSQLFEGKIWKCAALAYLKMQDEKYRLSGSWKPYLQYQPLAPECSDEQLAEFFRREEETFCGMCPASPEKFDLPDPMRTRRAR